MCVWGKESDDKLCNNCRLFIMNNYEVKPFMVAGPALIAETSNVLPLAVQCLSPYSSSF